MIDRALVLKLSLAAGALALAGAGIASAAHSLAFGGGIALGAALGVAPFLSWAWLLKPARHRGVAALALLAKLGLYSGALYLGVTLGHVRPVGVFVGITAVLAMVFAGAWIRISRPKEATS